MANIPMDDVQQIWDEMGDNKSWDSFREVVNKQQNQAGGIDDSLIEMMKNKMGDLQNKPFPDTPEDLHEMLNQEMMGEEAPPENENDEQNM